MNRTDARVRPSGAAGCPQEESVRWGGDLGPGEPVVAFDVGGTDVKCCLVDAGGVIVEIRRIPAPPPGADAGRRVVDLVTQAAAYFGDRHPEVTPVGAGLVVPGTVDEGAGIGVYSKNLGWSKFPFRERATEALGLAVAFGHDVRAAGVAEFRVGAAAPFSDAVVVAIGTGIAAAVFIDGRLHSGGGLAGEIGHARVADAPECGCGGTGCLEAVASASAIARRYSAASGHPVTGAKAVLERATAGDPTAVKVWESALDALALGISHAVLLLAPEAIVLAGGLAQAGPRLFAPLERRLDELLTFQHRPRLLPAAVGEDAGAIGAALLARDLRAADALDVADDGRASGAGRSHKCSTQGTDSLRTWPMLQRERDMNP